MTALLLQIADVASELADPRQHREPRWRWSEARHKVPLPAHVTTQPGLLVQLHEAIKPIMSSVDESGTRSVPKSSPPLQLDALNRWLEISTEAAWWCRLFGLDDRGDPILDVRTLVGAQHGDRAADVLTALRCWRSWAATMSGWQSIYTPHAACPVVECGRMGTLRINLHKVGGVCIACGAWWDETTITILAAHISNSTDGHEPIRVRSGWSGHGGWASRATQGAPA